MTLVHRLPIRVRYVETDQMGCVHHSQYLVYFEMGRTESLRATGLSYRQLEEKDGIYLVITRLEVKYIYPARYDDLLLLETTVDRATYARIDHSYRLYREADHRLLAEARSTLGCVNRQGEPRPLPERLLEVLKGPQAPGSQ